jgi:cytidine deaminase
MTKGLTSEQRELVQEASKARELAYAPYSRFKVGAAVRTKSGKIYLGCNIENVSYGLSMCAERAAIFNAVAAGDREITEIAVVTDADPPSVPCGACRQVLAEFSRCARIILQNIEGEHEVTSIKELFPRPFEQEDKDDTRGGARRSRCGGAE